MRGKVVCRVAHALLKGITPAYAGKSRPLVLRTSWTWDHPRVCGEKFPLDYISHAQTGSPPRMRGKGQALLANDLRVGITPAYAGKRRLHCLRRSRLWDHPRVCGEKNWQSRRLVIGRGSPPRMRGKVGHFGAGVGGRGITPAYAGKSWNSRWNPPCWKDHPRVCGEKPAASRPKAIHPGSPPRMRGKGTSARPRSWANRITPAYAGKRLKRSHRIGHFSCILCLFHSVLHRASASGGSRAGPCAPPCLPAQNAVPV